MNRIRSGKPAYLLGLLSLLALGAACSSEDAAPAKEPGSAGAAGATAKGGAAGAGARAGSGTAGNGTAGNAAAGNGTAGNGTAGNGTAGNGTAGSSSGASGAAGANAGGAGVAGNGTGGAAGKAAAGAAGNGTGGSAGKDAAAGKAGAAGGAGKGGAAGVAGQTGAAGTSAAGQGGVAGGNAAEVILREDFEDGSLPVGKDLDTTLPGGLGLGSDKVPIVLSEDGAFGGQGRSLKVTYPGIQGNEASSPYAGFSLAKYQTDHVYLRFRAKMPGAKHGLKFVKIFSKNKDDGEVGYANTTFGLDYTGVDLGSMYCVSYGDGGPVENDTANILGFAELGFPGRAEGKPGFSVQRPQGKRFASTDWGTDWHLFELYARFNTGTSTANEKNDGAYIVRIDGKTYLDAKGIFNRNPVNGKLDRVELLGWTQTPKGAAVPSFEIWYDNIEISLNDWAPNPL